jgi:N4-gp56 family major capsid protein
MATTDYGVNANETVKLWGRKLFRESLKQTFLRRFMGTNSNSIVQIKDDTTKGPGDRVTNILRVQLTGDGISGDSTLEGSEEALSTFTQNVLIDQLRHAVRSGGRMTEQRIPFSVRDEARLGLQDWWADRIDTALFNQLAGNNAQGDTKFTASNSVTAPDSAHHFWPDATTVSADESLTAAETMTIDLIDNLVMQAKIATPVLRPIMESGEARYVMFLHPGQVNALRTSTDTGQWLDIQKAAMQGGNVAKNPIWTGALGMYNQTILHESTRVPLGVNSSSAGAVANTRRAIFCGGQAATIAFGRNNGGASMTWVEELFDYQNQLGVSAGMVYGAIRNIFNAETFGSFVLSTYSTV